MMTAEPTRSRLGLGQLGSAGDPVALQVDAAVARHVDYDTVVDVEIDERGPLMHEVAIDFSPALSRVLGPPARGRPRA
jgi:hypothetical protein